MTDLEKLESFKKELAELLEKYDAEISVDWGDHSDMHGVYEEGLSVIINQKGLKLTDLAWYVDKDNINR